MVKAITIDEYGNPNVLKERIIPLPTLTDSQVLIEMYATSINPMDYIIRSGAADGMIPVQFPQILGLDIAGVVKEVGKQVTDFKAGDRVFGIGDRGSYAEYAVAEQASLGKISPTLPFREAGALPVVALTAWQALFHYGEVGQGSKVLIHAGAGGVGHMAIQMAKQSGAYVITTASARNHDFVKQLGADEIIDYTATDFSAALTDIDVVIDAVGDEVQERSFNVLKEGGRLIALAHPVISDKVNNYSIHAEFAKIKPNRTDLESIDEWVREQKLKVHVERVFSFSERDLIAAHRQSETKHTKGKLVVQMKE